jgi:hypothetical protein
MPDEPFWEKVYEGPEAEAVMVKLAPERDGVRCIVLENNITRVRLHGAVYVLCPTQAERARNVLELSHGPGGCITIPAFYVGAPRS